MVAKDRHKIVRCKVCSKSMRSDTLKRHTKTHKDILTMSDDNVRDELRARHSAQLLREERQQAVEEIAQQENIPIDYCKTSTTLVEFPSSLQAEMMQDNQDYLDKIELGRQVAAVAYERAKRSVGVVPTTEAKN